MTDIKANSAMAAAIRDQDLKFLSGLPPAEVALLDKLLAYDSDGCARLHSGRKAGEAPNPCSIARAAGFAAGSRLGNGIKRMILRRGCRYRKSLSFALVLLGGGKAQKKEPLDEIEIRLLRKAIDLAISGSTADESLDIARRLRLSSTTFDAGMVIDALASPRPGKGFSLEEAVRMIAFGALSKGPFGKKSPSGYFCSLVKDAFKPLGSEDTKRFLPALLAISVLHLRRVRGSESWALKPDEANAGEKQAPQMQIDSNLPPLPQGDPLQPVWNRRSSGEYRINVFGTLGETMREQLSENTPKSKAAVDDAKDVGAGSEKTAAQAGQTSARANGQNR